MVEQEAERCCCASTDIAGVPSTLAELIAAEAVDPRRGTETEICGVTTTVCLFKIPYPQQAGGQARREERAERVWLFACLRALVPSG